MQIVPAIGNDLKNLQVRLTRDLQITRSHHHATNAVYPPASPHGVFVWINFELAWISIWRKIVSPEFTNRCGVSAGMTTMPPAFTSRCSSPTVMVAQPSRVNA